MTPGDGTHKFNGLAGHETGYLSPDYLSGRAAVLSAVPGAWVNSDWRCPDGNDAVGSTSETKPHVLGIAGDFDAKDFDLYLW